MLHVTVIEGAEVVRSQVLTSSPAIIGRDSNNQLVIRNKHISGKHGEIRLEDGRVIFRDLVSTNGSWLRRNRWLIAIDARRQFTIEVQDGDELLLGQTSEPVRLRFCLIDASFSTSMPEPGLQTRVHPERDLDRASLLSSNRQAEAVIHDFASRVTANAGPRLVMESLASSCLAHFRTASDVAIYLCEGPSNELRPALHRGRDGEAPPQPLPHHIAIKALRDGALLFGADGAGPASLCAPVLNGQQPVAVIQVAGSASTETPFDQDDVGVLSELARQSAAPLANARLRSSVEKTLGLLVGAAESRDEFRSGRSASVAELVQRLGQKLGVKRDELRRMVAAAMVHDIGMLVVPSAVLNKSTPLTEDEMQLIRKHVETSVQILAPLGLLSDLVPIVLHHHERWDGTGYPQGLAGEAIPRGSRIMAAADSFCALVANNPHQKALSEDDALKELRRCEGSQFEPAVVDAMFAVIDGSEIWTEGARTERLRLEEPKPMYVLPKR